MYTLGVEITGADSGFTATANRVVGNLNKIGSAAAKAAVGAGKKFTESIGHAFSSQAAQFVSADFFLRKAEQTLEWADAMDRLHETFGVSTNDLQVLEQVSRTENVSMQTLASALRKMTVAMVEARKGSGDAFEAFSRFGIKTEGKTPLEVWSELGVAISNATDQQLAMADATKILGRNADQVLPALKANLKEISASLSGKFVSEANIKQLAEAQKTLESTGRYTTIYASGILSSLMRGLDLAHHNFGFGKAGEDEAFIEREAERNGGIDTRALEVTRDMAYRLESRRAAKRSGDELESLFNTYLDESAATEDWMRQGPSAKKSLGFAISGDSLTRIGGSSSAFNPQLRALHDVHGELKKMLHSLNRIDRDLTSED